MPKSEPVVRNTYVSEADQDHRTGRGRRRDYRNRPQKTTLVRSYSEVERLHHDHLSSPLEFSWLRPFLCSPSWRSSERGVARPESFTQNLSRRRFRDDVDEFDLPYLLVRCHLLRDEFGDLSLRQRCLDLLDDERFGYLFTRDRVDGSNDRDVCDVGVS